MAVDANVLIFERIREEVRKGLTPRAAVDEGYSRATLTILDANVTTIIAAIILYQFGTGPIRGFAVTLTLGILASMFTAIFVSRILFDLWTSKRKPAKLSV
jgi:preprotein translocase subunit SecD